MNAVAIQNDGKILTGGSFTQYNSFYVNRIVRLDGGVAGIDEIHNNDIFSVFPNPATEKIVINLLKKFPEPFTATLTNVLGKELKSFYKEDETSELHLNEPDGVYFLTLHNSKQRITKKIILQ